jgi:hypothetical protein
MKFEVALTVHLLSWRTHTKSDVSQAVKYIYINLNIGCDNKTNLFNNEISWCGN